jgi:hypothetical protein
MHCPAHPFDTPTLSRRQWLERVAAGGVAVLSSRSVRGQEGRYVRPFGPKAPWNVPVEHVPRHPDSAMLVERLFRDQTGQRSGKFYIAYDSHTYPVYDARSSTGPTPFKTFWESNLVGKVPWNPAWQPSSGYESQLVVIDPENGLEWDYFRVQFKLQIVQANMANMVTGDYRIKEDGFLPSRGSGLPYLAMLVRPDEVRQGKIEHALSLALGNVSSVNCVAPAMKFDFANAPRAGVPAGTRFSLTLSDSELDRWAEQLPMHVSDETRRAARIIAQALRDYGWFVTEAAPGALFQIEGRQSAGQAWDELGLGVQKARDREFPRQLLEGLFRTESVAAYAPSDEYPEEWRARPTPITNPTP